MASKKSDSERLNRLEELLGGLTLQVQKLLETNVVLPRAPNATVVFQDALPRVRLARPAPGGPPSAFMAYVNAQRGLRAVPLEDDPEAEALEAIADKLASMGPVEKRAFLDEKRQEGRRADLRKERKDAGLPDLSDAELDELLGAPSE